MKYVTAANLMYALLAFGALAVLVSLIRRGRDPKSRIHLDDLLLENGKMSREAVVMMGSFLLTTWMMIYLAADGKMTEGYLGLYVGGWIAPGIANRLSSRSQSYRQDTNEPPVYNREGDMLR